MSYEKDLAHIHDQGFSQLTLGAAPVILDRLRRAGIHDGHVVELGCGSGRLLAILEAAGYDATGVDSSRSMLRLARRRAPRARLKAGSLYEVRIPPCRAVISIGEGLNYLTSSQSGKPAVAELFRRVSRALPDGGLVIFDTILAMPASRRAYRTWQLGADWAVLVEVKPVGLDRLLRCIVTFRKAGQLYRRQKDAGFRTRTARGYGRTRVGPGRLVFFAVK